MSKETSTMDKVLIACVGGFLGAGKTTTLQRAAAEFANRGLKVGVITNDQGAGLVDTEALRQQGFITEEITGGCFCCKFDELVETAGALIEKEKPDVLLAEAVGSCTDLSATVYQPLQRYYPDRFRLAPLTIVVEPDRIRSLREAGHSHFPESVRYLFSKQLAEADLIVLNKIDTLDVNQQRAMIKWLNETIGGAPSCRSAHAPTSASPAGSTACWTVAWPGRACWRSTTKPTRLPKRPWDG